MNIHSSEEERSSKTCVLIYRPARWRTSNLGSLLRRLWRWPSYGLHRLVCWQKSTNGRKILPDSRFPRSTGILQDPKWHIERHNNAPIWTESVRLGQIFPRLRHCSHASKIPSAPHTGKADRQSQLKMFIIYVQLCYMFRPEQTVVR